MLSIVVAEFLLFTKSVLALDARCLLWILVAAWCLLAAVCLAMNLRACLPRTFCWILLFGAAPAAFLRAFRPLCTRWMSTAARARFSFRVGLLPPLPGPLLVP